MRKTRTTRSAGAETANQSNGEDFAHTVRFQPSQPLRRNRLGARRSPQAGFAAANLMLLPLGRGEIKKPIREASS